ncbi:MAG TPA: NAD(P)H-binding protein [Cellulomonas sp.]
MFAVIGAAGFVGAALTTRLAAGPEPVRILVRDEGRARARLGAAAQAVELVVGDMHDERALDSLLAGTRAVYTTAQTVTARQPAGAGDFATAERRAADLVLAAAARHRVGRLVTVGLIGASGEATNPWVRSRADLERSLLAGPVPATVLRPGLVVGRGSVGFDGLVTAAGKSTAVIRGSGRQRWSYIALADLVGYLVDVVDLPAAAGQVFDVGSEEAPTYRELVARTAHLLGRRAPRLLPLPLPLLRAAAPVVERAQGMPAGGLRAAIAHLGDDLVGDTAPVRALLPRELAGWDAAAGAALAATTASDAASPRR